VYRAGTHDEQIIDEIWNRKEYWLPHYDIEPAHMVIDIGAHIGAFATWAASKGATVYAFEPEPENHSMLVQNVKGLDVIAMRNGVQGKPGKRTLYKWEKTPGNTGNYSMYWNDGGESVEVDCITLAEALEIAGGKCDFLKLDCEGAEYDILYSLHPFRLRNIKRIVCEWHGSRDASIRLADYLRNQGYIMDRQGMESHEYINDELWGRGHIFARRGDDGEQRYD